MNSPTPIVQGQSAKAEGRRRKAEYGRPSAFSLQPSAFTLIEMLVALVITLIMMGAVVTLFGVVSESVSASRSAIELSDRLRAARNQLQLDLRGATATTKPPLRPENDEGYFEIIEGELTDRAAYQSYSGWSLFGDVDDVLMFTTRSRGAPFVGKLNGVVIESPVAEVAYFLAQDIRFDASGNLISVPPPVIDATTAPSPTRLYTLYRRVLLVTPGVPPITAFNDHFYDDNDISIRYESPGGTPTLIANTLGDLTKRENRFAHYGIAQYGVFPFAVDPVGLPALPLSSVPTAPSPPVSWPVGPPARPTENAFLAPAVDARVGDDVLLTNVLSFDVQVWDPTAPVRESGGVALEPHDPGWAGAGAAVALGAYVDLGFDLTLTPASVFSGSPHAKSGLTVPFVYDTWSLHYENDGVKQNTAASAADLGTNGLDDDGDGIVDEIDYANTASCEYDTLPPYSAPLRGIRVTIRVYEPASQQVREVVVVQNFLPE